MKKITVTLNVDEAAVMAESGQNNLEDAIRQELGWLHDSGMFVDSLSFAEEKNVPIPSQVSVLCEEYENDDGIREFSILGVSTDKNALRKLMEAKIEQDEYGFIAENGVDEHRNDHFITNFEDGFVEYYILDEAVLSRNEVARVAAGELDPYTILREAQRGESPSDSVSVSKHGLSGLIRSYINELEEQEVMHAEIVSLLIDSFPRETLEELGFGEFIEDCLMTEQDWEEAQRHAKTPLDTKIANAQAAQKPAEPGIAEKGKTLPEQGRE